MAIESVTSMRSALEFAAENMRIWADRLDQVGAIVAQARKGVPRADALLSAAHFLADDGAESLRCCASSAEDAASARGDNEVEA